MTMFHLVFPRRRGFLHWDELGCLARSLGFQEDVFQQNINFEIRADEDGLKLKEIVTMLDLKLLYRPLHRTFNMHTAGWNMAVIRKSIQLLDYHALTFEELHNIRVSYEMYEAIDMKGLYLDQHILLRAIKMCGRFIAPMKLMHRIKHMKSSFDENGRIQLYEFLDLIMWCDFYQSFNPEEMEYSEGKDKELFKLVDFGRLLSHHDERVARQLNQQYLQDEWDFGRETLGSKSMFRDPPVNNEQRLKQTKLQKDRYRHLKEQVGHSQRRVFQALAGYVRQRPISAPDLSMYCRDVGSDVTTPATAKQVYQSVQRRLRSAPVFQDSFMDLTDRPQTRQYVRVTTPVAVSNQEMTEIDQKMEQLDFAITTLDSRLEIHKEREMQTYIPSYLEKLANRPPQESTEKEEPQPEPAPKPKRQGLSEEAVRRLAYPPPRLPPSHARKCDARFRGWLDVRKKPGSHYVLVASTLEPSPVGSQLIKMRERLAKEVPQHHSDYVYRYTRKREIQGSTASSSLGHGQQDSRPITAPAAMDLGVEPLDLAEEGEEGEGEDGGPLITNGAGVTESAGVSSRAELHMQRSESATVDQLMKMTNLYEAQLAGGGGGTNLLPENVSSASRQISLEREAAFGLEPLSVSTPLSKTVQDQRGKDAAVEDKSAQREREPPVVDLILPVPVSSYASVSAISSNRKPKKIDMGQIGTVTLLESITEADPDEELSYVTTELSSEREEEEEEEEEGEVVVARPSRLALTRDSVGGTPEEKGSKEDSPCDSEETGTATTSSARITSAERRSILVRREGSNTPYGYRPPRSPSPGKERRNVKYDENSLRKETMTSDQGDVTHVTDQSDSRTAPTASQKSPPIKKMAAQEQQLLQPSSENTTPRTKQSDSGSPDSKVSRGWDSPVKVQQPSPRGKAARASERYNFPTESNFPLDSVNLGRRSQVMENTPREANGTRTQSAKGSGEFPTPESSSKKTEDSSSSSSSSKKKKMVLSPRNRKSSAGGQRAGRSSCVSFASGTRLTADFSTPKSSPRESVQGDKAATKKGKTQGPKYGKFVKRYEKDLPPYLKNRLLTAGTS